MGTKTGIEWTDATWNPIRGCSLVSEGCRNCYAMHVAARFNGPGQTYEGLATRGPAKWTGDVRFIEEHLTDPLRWKHPRRIFVNSMSDVFHEAVTFAQIDEIFAVMALCPQHTFQLLTKRPGRMVEYFASRENGFCDGAAGEVLRFEEYLYNKNHELLPTLKSAGWSWQVYYDNEGFKDSNLEYDGPLPLPNVWLGVSVEDQKTADHRIPQLLQTPAAVRWISAEPLLGPVDLTHLRCNWNESFDMVVDALAGLTGPAWKGRESTPDRSINTQLDWVVVGGESGHNARPMHPDWAYSLRDQCIASKIPFLFKQWGNWLPVTPLYEGREDEAENGFEELELVDRRGYIWTDRDGQPTDSRTWLMANVGKKLAGRSLDCRTWNEYPEAIA